jgi:hypothetical protein
MADRNSTRSMDDRIAALARRYGVDEGHLFEAVAQAAEVQAAALMDKDPCSSGEQRTGGRIPPSIRSRSRRLVPDGRAL